MYLLKIANRSDVTMFVNSDHSEKVFSFENVTVLKVSKMDGQNQIFFKTSKTEKFMQENNHRFRRKEKRYQKNKKIHMKEINVLIENCKQNRRNSVCEF